MKAKLFTGDLEPSRVPAMEESIAYLQQIDMVAAESLTDFYAQAKDAFTRVYTKLTGVYVDNATRDILKNKFQMLAIAKRANFVYLGPRLTSKPENFQGFYTDYLLSILSASKETTETIFESFEKLKYFISYYINDYKSDMFDTNNSIRYFKNIEKNVEDLQKTISVFFKAKDHTTKAEFREVYRTLNDFEAVYKSIDALDKSLNEQILKQISKLTQDCVELIDTLIENNSKNQGNLINDTVKKNLSAALYGTAKQVEFAGYLYANIVTFYGVFKNNLDDLKTFSEMDNK